MNIEAIHRLNMWCETSSGKIAPVNLQTREMPSIELYPFAVARFPLVIRTEHYRRRPDGSYGENDRLGVSTSSANAELVLALVTGGNARQRPIWQYFRFHRPRKHSLEDALVIASEACGRCLNALAYEYGLVWGFPEFSEEWHATNTRCLMCEESASLTTDVGAESR